MTLTDFIANVVSGEWIITLSRKCNSGGVIFLRAVWVAVLTWLAYSATILPWTQAGSEILAEATTVPDMLSKWLRFSAEKLLPMAATAFGGTYAALYARFASQWEYLAGVYNNIKQAQVNIALGEPDRAEQSLDRLSEWQKAFIEDAVSLHLAFKPAYASVVRNWGQDERVRARFREESEGSLRRLNEFVAIARAACRH
jgi:hypothetical protein